MKTAHSHRRPFRFQLFAIPTFGVLALLGAAAFHPIAASAKQPKDFDSRIVHGTVGSAGTFADYSVSFTPTGTGGTPLTGSVTLTLFSDTVTGAGTSFTTELQVDAFIKVPENGGFQIYQVRDIQNDTQLRLTTIYRGSSTGGVTAFRNMTLAPVWRIDFTQPFQGAPTIALTGRGDDGFVIKPSGSGPVPNNYFEVTQVGRTPFITGTAPFDFIAVGQ